MITSVGLWIDGPVPRAASVDAWAGAVAATGVDVGSIFLNPGAGPRWVIKWPAERLAAATRALRLRGIQVRWTMWPYATENELRQWGAQLAQVANVCRAAGVAPALPDLDLEGKHHGWTRRGADPAMVALLFDLLGEAYQEQTDQEDWFVTVNCIPPLGGLRDQDLAAIEHPWVRELVLQAYSQYQPDKRWTHHDLMRPGNMQPHAGRLAAPLLEAGIIDRHRMGCANYAQQHPTGPRGVDALWAAVHAASAWTDALMYWSYKHVRNGSRVNRASLDFFQALTSAARAAAIHEGVHAEAMIRAVQRALVALGLEPGPVDGALGPLTRAAVERFEASRGLEADGELDPETLEALLGAA